MNLNSHNFFPLDLIFEILFVHLDLKDHLWPQNRNEKGPSFVTSSQPIKD